jgi:hypothetical protein
MTDPDNLIDKLNAEIAYYDQPSRPDGHHANITERVLIEARDMILTLVKERDAAEIAHVQLGYN